LQFCNYLTSGDKSKGVYQFSGNNISPGDFLGINRATAIALYGTIYAIPTADEWHKAAYYKSDGSGYSLYANGSDTPPLAGHGWIGFSFRREYKSPWNVGTGTMEQNGTFDMMGNVCEWDETIVFSTCRGLRGGSYNLPFTYSSAPKQYCGDGCYENYNVGFRIAEIPEPTTICLFALASLMLRKK
jgi:formylglycine-generating enzyme required for sulfatase activity